jgi:hypothetical protein
MASAGEYHKYTQLICSDCHTMHASRTHQFGSNAADTFVGINANGNDKLLVKADIIRTCLNCHNGNDGTAPDVFENNTGGGSPVGFRAAGALNSATTYGGVPQDTGYDAYMGHSMGYFGKPPGFDFTKAQADFPWISADWDTTAPFQCTDCHSAHGGAGYRNLGPAYGFRLKPEGGAFAFPKPSYTKNSGTALDMTTDVNLFAAGQNTYDARRIVYTGKMNGANDTGSATGSNNNKFCAVCHGVFHRDPDVANGTGPFQRHPTSQVSFTATALLAPDFVSLKLLVVTPGSFTWANQVTQDFSSPAGVYQPGCVTCHKGHGSQNSFGLFIPAINTDPTGAALKTPDANLESGSGTSIRQLCINCHPMGRQ